jgi:hypothetical protein
LNGTAIATNDSTTFGVSGQFGVTPTSTKDIVLHVSFDPKYTSLCIESLLCTACTVGTCNNVNFQTTFQDSLKQVSGFGY